MSHRPSHQLPKLTVTAQDREEATMRITVNEVDRGRRALITGASSGIGRDVARVFAEHGFSLVVTARRLERLEALARELKANYGTDVVVVQADLSLADGPVVLMDEIDRRGLDVDILVNCAGTGDGCAYTEIPWDAHQQQIQLMALSPARLIHLALPGMLKRGYGRVVNVTSVAAHMPGVPLRAFYCPTKSFLYKLTEGLCTEYHGTGVTFTATAPGFTESELVDLSGARTIVDKLPGFMLAETRVVAEQTVAACLAGVATYTHLWFNRLFFGGFLRHFPTRYAHKLMLSERALRERTGDVSVARLPGLPSLRHRRQKWPN